MSTPGPSAVTSAVESFVTFAQRLTDDDNLRSLEHYPRLAADPAYVEESRRKLSVEYGRRYAKIVASSRGSQSVYCFVDLTNGDILKAESWRKPAKHARGSIYQPAGWKDAITAYGARYLR